MIDSLRCAIIGYGYMGEIRARVIQQHPDLLLTLICEPNLQTSLPGEGATFTKDSSDVVSSDVDVVFICTPNKSIPDLVIQCLDQQKHVFCEKPPGRTVDDILRIREAETRNPRSKLMFGFNHRYHPGIMRAKNIVDSGGMGEILTLRGLYGKSGGRGFKDSWRNDASVSGGGILLDQGVHMLDLFNFFLGRFISVKAFMSDRYWGFDVEDNAMVILKSESGQLATLHSSATFWKHMFQLSITLEQGYINLDGLLSKSGSYGRETLHIGQRQFETESEAVGNPSEEVIYFDNDSSWTLEVGQFIEYILSDEPVVENTSRDALSVMELVHRCYKDDGKVTRRREQS